MPLLMFPKNCKLPYSDHPVLVRFATEIHKCTCILKYDTHMCPPVSHLVLFWSLILKYLCVETSSILNELTFHSLSGGKVVHFNIQVWLMCVIYKIQVHWVRAITRLVVKRCKTNCCHLSRDKVIEIIFI